MTSVWVVSKSLRHIFGQTFFQQNLLKPRQIEKKTSRANPVIKMVGLCVFVCLFGLFGLLARLLDCWCVCLVLFFYFVTISHDPDLDFVSLGWNRLV